MSLLRKFLAWVFGIQAFVYLVSYVVLPALDYRNLPLTLDLPAVKKLLVFNGIYFASGVVSAIAWWTFERQRASFRVWSLSASVFNLLMWLPALYFVPRVHWGDVLPLTFLLHAPVGIAGLAAFWRVDISAPRKNIGADSEYFGDGTNEWVNKLAGSLVLIGGLAAFTWWQFWFTAKGIPLDSPNFPETLLLIFVTVMAVDPVIQLTTTAVGLALGMRLRAFAIGPFSWSYRSGRYQFRFEPARFLSVGGATGFIPSRFGYRPVDEICVLAAGPVAALFGGVIALWIALVSPADSSLQMKGFLALFGAMSLDIAAVHLIPYRSKTGTYSPGALIAQILRGGPWSDLHQTMGEVTSSLMGPTRPKDFNIERITRAATTIKSGNPGFILRLIAYSHFLDRGMNTEAANALMEAESVCQTSALNLPAPLHTDLIFGNAYLCRNAASARGWWDRMQASNGILQNVDYWRAKSALHWVEGDLQDAEESWAKANALAQKLPNAGVYEFDRYCCDLLHAALDAA